MSGSGTPSHPAAFAPGAPLDPDAWDADGATEMMDALAAGSFFGDRFRIGAPLGIGAMGRVVQAIDLHDGSEVALKLLHPERAREPEALERFHREAAILAAIGHPAIVRVIAMGTSPNGTPWLAMELLRGETLKQRLARGPLEPRAILDVLNALCDALAAAHTRGIVHRDLKPENVILPPSGQPACKLLDFGLSRFTASKTLTRNGTILGTPRYMAPEQIRAAASADLRSDVFSVGVLLYEMLAARSPYPAEDLGQLLGCVLEGRTIPLSQVRPDLPAEVGAVITRAMARAPGERFQTAGAIAEAYANALGMESGRSMLRSAPELPSHPGHDEGAQPLIDQPFALAPGALPPALRPGAAPIVGERVSSPGAAFTRPRSSTPAPAPPAPRSPARAGSKRSLAWIAFGVAVVLVVIGATVAALLLRALVHGSVHLPGMTLSP